MIQHSSAWIVLSRQIRQLNKLSSSAKYRKVPFHQRPRVPFLSVRTIHGDQRGLRKADLGHGPHQPQHQRLLHYQPQQHQPQQHQQPSLESEDARFPTSLLRPTLFLVIICGGSYFIASYLTHRSSNALIDRCRTLELDPTVGKSYIEVRISDAIARVSWATRLGLPMPVLEVYRQIEEWWATTLSPYHATYTVIAFNTLVFLAWRIPTPAVQSFMTRHFTHQPLSGKSYTLLTSVFSHYSIAHFAFNMLAFYSFGPPAFTYLHAQALMFPNISRMNADELRARESTFDPELKSTSAYWHALAFYLSAGTMASYIPHLVKILHYLPRTPVSEMTSWLNFQRAIGGALPAEAVRPLVLYGSLGASGAVYATVAISALAFPEAEVSLIFLPFLSFSIRTGVGAMVALDVLGVVRGWRMLGHMAHLTGAAVGGAAVAVKVRGDWMWPGEAGLWRGVYYRTGRSGGDKKGEGGKLKEDTTEKWW